MGAAGGQRHSPAALPLGKRPSTHLQEAGWAPGPVWAGAEILAATEIRSPDRPACSEELCRLRNPGPLARLSSELYRYLPLQLSKFLTTPSPFPQEIVYGLCVALTPVTAWEWLFF